MSFFTMKRLWVAMSLPFFIGFMGGKSALVLTGIIWFPVSIILMTWAFFTNQKNKKSDRNITNLVSNRSLDVDACSKQPTGGNYLASFMKMKRLWIALAIPGFIIYMDGFGGNSLLWKSGLLWMPVSIMLLLTALNSSALKTSNKATVDNFNDHNDGCYSHTLSYSSMRINSRKRTIDLKDGRNEKTYSFDDIESWRYNISYGDAIEGAGLNLAAINLNNMRLAENRAETGFFIKVRDIHNPEWQIHFFPKEGSFKNQKGIKNLEKHMNQWVEVFNQIVNKNKG